MVRAARSTPICRPTRLSRTNADFDSKRNVLNTRGVSPTVHVGESVSPAPSTPPSPITLRVRDSFGATGTQVTTLTIRENRPAVIRYDFGISGSPVQAGFVGVMPQDLYSATRGYGWVSRVAGSDRKDPTMSALRRDLIYARDATFKVNFDPTKTYNIRVYHANPKGYGTVSYVDGIYQGNPSASGSVSFIADNFSVYAEGIVKYNVAVVPAGGTVVRTISNVSVSADGVLELQFRDLGGQDANFVVSGLEISAGALPAETRLLAEGDPREEARRGEPGQLPPVVAEASARWGATGLTADQAAAHGGTSS